MKNTIKRFEIIALVAVIGFSMAACDLLKTDDGKKTGESKYTPITQIPANYLNTYWSIASISCSVTFGSDASKFDFYQIGQGTKTITNFSPVSKNEIEKGFDSGLKPSGFAYVSFMNDGSKLNFAGMSNWEKIR